MAYRVLANFSDMKDGNHAYKEGDLYPREGVTVSEARIKELSGIKNRRGFPLIAKIETAEETPVEEKPAEEKPKRKKRED